MRDEAQFWRDSYFQSWDRGYESGKRYAKSNPKETYEDRDFWDPKSKV